MSAAIPLSAPNGTVYAYACAVCHHIGSSGGFLSPHDPEQVAQVAEFSQRDADRCCRCERCAATAGPFNFGDDHVCAPCRPAHVAEREARIAAAHAESERSAAVRDSALRTSKDPVAAASLAARMSDISEECWAAGWLVGLEFSLWEMVQNGAGEYGMGAVSEEEVSALRDLSEKCGGWIRWQKNDGEVFVASKEWARIYDEYKVLA